MADPIPAGKVVQNQPAVVLPSLSTCAIMAILAKVHGVFMGFNQNDFEGPAIRCVYSRFRRGSNDSVALRNRAKFASVNCRG